MGQFDKGGPDVSVDLYVVVGQVCTGVYRCDRRSCMIRKKGASLYRRTRSAGLLTSWDGRRGRRGPRIHPIRQIPYNHGDLCNFRTRHCLVLYDVITFDHKQTNKTSATQTLAPQSPHQLTGNVALVWAMKQTPQQLKPPTDWGKGQMAASPCGIEGQGAIPCANPAVSSVDLWGGLASVDIVVPAWTSIATASTPVYDF